MVKIPRVTARFRVVSPLFMGNAEQQAEVRGASFKGVLRAWYRAVEPRFRSDEAALFGGAGKEGQSRVLLRARSDGFEPMLWDKDRSRRFSQGYGRKAINGLIYLGWPFQFARGRPRSAIPPGTRITLEAVSPRPLSDRQRRGLLASLWLLGRLGSLGTRSTRGFGSLVLEELVAGPGLDERWHRDLEQLPVAVPDDVAAWRRGMEAGLATICRQWFEPWDERHDHAHVRLPLRQAIFNYKTWSGDEAWLPALATAGEAMQLFRRSAGKGDARLAGRYLKTGLIDRGPERAAFGLPLAFQFPGGRGQRPQRVAFVPMGDREQYGTKPFERHASLVRLRLVELGGGLTPLYFQLAGAIPGHIPPSGVRGEGQALPPVSEAILGEFFKDLGGEWTL